MAKWIILYIDFNLSFGRHTAGEKSAGWLASWQKSYGQQPF